MRAPIREIFCSVQGEGPYVGVRQAFLRFEGCNLSCPYCDTPQGTPPETCRIEVTPGRGDFRTLRNPLPPRDVEEAVLPYRGLHSLALTGGEPLLHSSFIRELKLPIDLYLESNMTLPDGAREVREKVRYVAGDVKGRECFPSAPAYEEALDRTLECFRILRKGPRRDCFAKVVLPGGFRVEAIAEALGEIERYVSSIVLQPVTPRGKNDSPSPGALLSLQERLLEGGRRVRIIPQTHKAWGAL
jgi:organic radical activating enzyme